MGVLRFTHFFQHVLDSQPCGTIALSPASISDIVFGEAFSETISASGGTAPYTFAVTSGALPTGLSLNVNTGAITGTPTVFESVSFTITATDADSCTGSQAYSFDVVPETDAAAFITAAGITDDTQKAAINNLVLDLKGYSIWTKMVGIYPFVGGTATTHKFNLKDPRDLDAAYRLTFNGGITHSSNGADPNGTNAYADTHFAPVSTTSAHLSIYSRDNSSTGTSIDIGCVSGAQNRYLLTAGSSSTTDAICGFGNPITTSTELNSQGFYAGTLNGTTSKLFKNGVLKDPYTVSTIIPPFAGNVTVLGVSPGSLNLYSNRQLAWASFGQGLTDTDVANLNTAVQTFQTTLSRNV